MKLLYRVNHELIYRVGVLSYRTVAMDIICVGAQRFMTGILRAGYVEGISCLLA